MKFLLTIELLDALDVIVRKSEVFHKSIDRSHQSSWVLRMLQTKGVTKLMGRHQEQAVAWKQSNQMVLSVIFLFGFKLNEASLWLEFPQFPS